jgi:polyhydroxybutyrate depolymerase
MKPSKANTWLILLLVAVSACGSTAKKSPSDNKGDASTRADSDTSSLESGQQEAEARNKSKTVCGNGVTESPEQCDDGNQDDTDGCTSLCEFTCTDDDGCDNGNVCDGIETCTERHTCVAGVTLKDGDPCGSTSTCIDGRCTKNICGDGRTQPDEECDDGDQDDTNGCTSHCLFTCVPDDPSRECANDCNPESVCDSQNHTCSSGSPLPETMPCNKGLGYCSKGKCIAFSCGETAKLTSQQCGNKTHNNQDAGPEDKDNLDAGTSDAGEASAGTANTERTYIAYIPDSLNSSKPSILVFVHHGFTMSGEIMSKLTSWTKIADENGFVVAFPDGPPGTPWNVGEGAVCGMGDAVNNKTQDDFGFVQKMIDEIDSKVPIDHSKIFTTGFSMGGFFANNIGCRRPEMVRAIAPHSGGAEIDYQCPVPRPVMIIHGTADPIISYQCGLDARAKWVKANGCSTEVDTVQVKGGVCERNRNCPAGAQVEMCSFQGMSHGWAGSDATEYGGIYGGGSEYEDAARLAWRFFQEQLKN